MPRAVAAVPAMCDGRFDAVRAGATSVADEVRAVAIWLARRNGRPRTLLLGELDSREQRRVAVFCDHFGLCGQASPSVVTLAARYDVSRGRVYQILDSMMAGWHGSPPALAHLERLRDAIEAAGVMSEEEFIASQRELLGTCCSLRDLDRFARQFCGYRIGQVGPRQRADRIVPLKALADDAALPLVRAVRDASLGMIRCCGAAHLPTVAGMASAILDAPVHVRDVTLALNAMEPMRWLNDERDWFWFGPERANRVLAVVRKVLSVADRHRIDAELLSQSISRSRRTATDDPSSPAALDLPRAVLLGLCSDTDWLSVIHYSDVALADGREAVALRGVERTVADAIAATGGVASRRQLMQRLVDPGRTGSSALYTVLANSPIILPLGGDLFAVRGAAIGRAAALVGEASRALRVRKTRMHCGGDLARAA